MDDWRPWTLTWAEVDPRQHQFDPEEARRFVRRLVGSAEMPVITAGTDGTPSQSGAAAQDWTDAITRALLTRYGRWASGWRWARDEGEIGGGPVSYWCCSAHSIGTFDETVTRVAGALIEWREWMEQLADLFESFALSAEPEQAQLAAWERAVAQVVTAVSVRTRAGDAWYSHCAQVLRWCLAHAGVPDELHKELVTNAIGGRFESWVAPPQTVIDDIGSDLAKGLRELGSDA